MGECAGKEASEYLRAILAKKHEVNMMFAATPSQKETLSMSCSEPGIDWNRVNAFHMDEYVGLDPEHPAGFRNLLKRSIFDRFPFKSVNLLEGNTDHPEQVAKEYDTLLRAHPLDLCLMGVGENGHIAFNDPPVANFEDPVLVKVVELESRCRMQQVHDGCFKFLDNVPTHALSATVPALIGAARLFCSVPATNKAEAVWNMLEGAITTDCPASILRTDPAAALYLDRDSARYLLYNPNL